MGVFATVTVICTIPAYTYTISEYLSNGAGPLGYTGVVNGARCAFQLTNVDGGDLQEIFNTTTGQPIVEGINCTVPVGTTTCVTPYITFNGAAFATEYIEFEQFYQGSLAGALNGTYNWSYIALPPVPSQPPQSSFTSDGMNINLTTSAFSQEYGYPLIGCVVSAGPTPYAGGLAPATLSSNPSANNIPYGAVAIYASPPTVTQLSTVFIPLKSLYVAPSTKYDFHFTCYNSVGGSPDIPLYNITTSAALPVPVYPSSTAAPQPQPSGASTSVSSVLVSLAVSAGVAALGLLWA